MTSWTQANIEVIPHFTNFKFAKFASICGSDMPSMPPIWTTRTALRYVVNARETTGFLGLPRELRDRIYIAVLRTSACPPPFPDSMGGTNCNTYPRFPLPSTTSALLTLNRQVHSEFKEVISRNEIKRPLIYKLDCIIVDDWGLRPTWLSIPALSKSVDVMEINFRFFGDANGCCSGDTFGWPGRLRYNLRPLLGRFLRSGPDFLSPAKANGFKIGELVLNVVSVEQSREGVIPFQPDSFLPTTGLKVTVTPKTIMSEIAKGIEQFCHAISEFRDSVQVIRLCVDGKGVKTWDVTGGPPRSSHWSV